MDSFYDEIFEEILDEVEESQGMPDAERAKRFEDRGRTLPTGAPGRAAWLGYAGEAWRHAGDLPRARSCYEAAVEDGGAAYIDPRSQLLGVLLELGEDDRAEALLTDLGRLARSGHHTETLHATVGEELELVGRLEEALRWYDAGLARSARASREDPDVFCLNGHFRVRRTLELPHDSYDELAEERRREYAHDLAYDLTHDEAGHGPDSGAGDGPDSGAGDDTDSGTGDDTGDDTGDEPVTMTALYWPPEEFSRALERFPSLAEDYGTDHAGHRELVELHLRQLAVDRPVVAVSLGSFEGYLLFAERRGGHAADASTRASYAAHLGHLGRTIPWPPAPEEPCWCGSELTYQRCCGAIPDAPPPTARTPPEGVDRL